jgi:predicted nucleic acid-binding protein
MREFVVDTNILFTFFWKDSFTKGLLIDQDFIFFSPEYALEELENNSLEIMDKTNISKKEFYELLEELKIFVEFIPMQEYEYFLEKVENIPDKDDLDFIALALKLQCPVWSNDSHVKKQNLVKVFTTEELLKIL